jgi:Ser/Thr protein kinase RdoA (MazF antagonist)
LQSEGELLTGGNMAGAVIRIGGTVRRRAGPWTPAVHDLLRHLERAGFCGAPCALGSDAEGREVLTYIPGEIAHPRVLEDAELSTFARLIREYHHKVALFHASPGASWSTDGQDPSTTHELVCHNDLAPWNLVIGKHGELAFIDWDLAAPGRRLWDLALAACTFVPMYPSATRQLERFRIFCDAYGLTARDRVELLDVTAQRTRRMWQVLVDNAGREPYLSLVRDGHVEFWQGLELHVRAESSTWRARLGV